LRLAFPPMIIALLRVWASTDKMKQCLALAPALLCACLLAGTIIYSTHTTYKLDRKVSRLIVDPAGNDTEPSEDVQRQIEDLQRSLEDVKGGMTELEDRLHERTDRLSEDIQKIENESQDHIRELEDKIREAEDSLKADIQKNADAIAELQGGNETLIGWRAYYAGADNETTAAPTEAETTEPATTTPIPLVDHAYLVTVGGENGFKKALASMETKLMPNGSQCPTSARPNAFPQGVEGAAAGLLDGTNIVCGGSDSDLCYALQEGDNNNWEWVEFTNITARRHHAIVSLPDKLWIMGGLDADDLPLASTEYVYADGSVEAGPDMPAALAKMCAIQANDAQILVAGGRGEGNESLANTWIFQGGYWSAGPALAQARLSHGCAKINGLVVAMGGLTRDLDCVGADNKNCTEALASVETIDATYLTGWEEGEAIPTDKPETGLYGMGVVQTETGVIVTGGLDKPHLKADGTGRQWIYYYNRYRALQSVLRLECDDVGCEWTRPNNLRLRNGRGHHVSFLVQRSEPECWRNNH